MIPRFGDRKADNKGMDLEERMADLERRCGNDNEMVAALREAVNATLEAEATQAQLRVRNSESEAPPSEG